ncbi:MAG: polysaccharide biosynthesis tyrosine autokinase [Hyphomicrobiaceae bacterium]
MNIRHSGLHTAFGPDLSPVDPMALQVPQRPGRLSGIDAVFILRALRRQARLVGIILIAGLLATFAALKLVSPRYMGTASLFLDIRAKDLFEGQTDASGGADDMMRIESQLELLRSKRIAGRVMSGLAPADRTYFEKSSPGFGEAKADAGSDLGLAVEEPTAASIEQLLKGLVVERKGRSYLVEVRYLDTNKDRAATIANAFVNAYVADQLEAKQGAARAANLWLEQRIEEISQELESYERRRQAFRAAEDLIEVGDMSLLEREIGDTALQLTSARTNVAAAAAKLEQVRKLASDPKGLLSLDTSIQSPVIGEFRRQMGEVKRKLAKTASQFGASHPDAVAAQAELKQLEESISLELQRIVENAELELETEVGKVKLLDADLKGLKSRSAKLGGSEVKLAELQREIDATSNLYVTMLRRYKETKAQEKLQTADAYVVTYAAPATSPSFPKTGLVLLFAGLCWAGLGASAGVGREIMLPVLRRRSDVERCTGVQCIAELPSVDLSEDGAQDAAKLNLLGPVHWQLDDHLAGRFNQGILNLRQWALGGAKDGPQVVLVTGVRMGDGCSTVALQLAAYAARTGLRAALVDGNLRISGISDILWSGTDLTFVDVVLSGDEPNRAGSFATSRGVEVFPNARRSTATPLEILGSRAMGRFIEYLRGHFDLIVIDTPPISDFADAEAIAEHVDSSLIVTKAGSIDHGEINEAVERLTHRPVPDVGVVLNLVDPERA